MQMPMFTRVLALGEEPPVERRDVAIEDHLDLSRREVRAVPPAHQRRDAPLRAWSVEKIECAPSAQSTKRARSSRPSAMRTPTTRSPSRRSRDARTPASSLAPAALRFVDEQLVEVATQEHHRRGVRREHHRATARRDDLHRLNGSRELPQLVTEAELVHERDRVRERARAARLVAGERGAVEQQHARRIPARASRKEAVAPDGPAPTTMTSWSFMACMLSSSFGASSDEPLRAPFAASRTGRAPRPGSRNGKERSRGGPCGRTRPTDLASATRRCRAGHEREIRLRAPRLRSRGPRLRTT